MTINLHLPTTSEVLRPTITVVGVGGAGGNAVNNMIASNLDGINFVVANTDAQALDHSLTDRTIQLGAGITKGLGAGANPEIGRSAAAEARDEIAAHIEGSNMVFITAGMGGGTGTGAAGVVAEIAKELDILTVGVVTKPFQFEGAHRMRLAESGLKELQEYVDTLIIIPNQNLFRVANERTTFADAFKMADEVLHSGVRGITDLIVKPGLINLDFSDIRTVMCEMGKAMMGTGEAGGERRAIEAAEAAISNPLLDDVSLKGARALLINITGGGDMTLFEVDEAANRVREEVDPEANIIFGSAFNDAMEGSMRVSVVATGIDAPDVLKTAQHSMGINRKADVKNPYLTQQQAASASAPRAPLMPSQPEVASESAQQQAIPRVPTPREPVAHKEEEISASVQAMVERANTAMHIDKTPAASEEFDQQEPVARYSDFDNDMPSGAPLREPASAASPEEAFADADTMTTTRTEDHSARVREIARTEMAAAAGSQERGFFKRMAGVGRALSVRQEEEQQERVQVVKQSAEVSEKAARLAEEDQYLDIPAFLRRQAN